MRWRRVLAWCGGGVAALVLVLFLVLQTPAGMRGLGAVVSWAASTPQSRLEIAGLRGSFPTDLAADRIELADADGPWLRIEQARIDWTFAPVFSRRLAITSMSAARVTVLRPPLPSAEPTSSDRGDGRPFLDIDLGSLAIAELHLAPPIGGIDSRWRIDGSGRLARTLPTSRLSLTAERVDRPSGRLSAEIQFDPALRQVAGELSFEERSDQGVAAALLGRPDLDAVSLRLQARGSPGDGRMQFLLVAGDAVTANGTGEWKREDGRTRGTLRLTSTAPGLPDGPLARLLRRQTSLVAEGTLHASNVIVFTATLEAAPGRIVARGRHDLAADALEATATVEFPDSEPLSGFLGDASWRDLKAELRAELRGVSTRPHGKLEATFTADQVIAALPPVPALGRVEGSAKVNLHGDGLLKVEAFEARSPLLSINTTGDVSPGARTVDARTSLTVTDFTPLSNLAGTPLQGNGAVDITLKVRDGSIEASWQGSVRELTIDRFPAEALKPDVALAGTVELRRDRSWRLRSLGLSTDAASLTVDGNGRGGAGEIDISLKLIRLGAFEPAAEGNATLAAKLTLQESGAATLQLDSSGRAMGQPLSLTGRARREPDGRLVVPSLRGQWASATIDVADFVLANKEASGTARMQVEDLRDIGHLIGETMAGSLELDVKADPAQAKDKVSASLRGRKLPGLGGLTQLEGTLESDLGTADVTVRASGPGLAASLKANVQPTTEGLRFVVTRLEGHRGDLAASLAGTTRAHLVGTRLTLEQATKLTVAGTTVTLAGVVDPAASDLTADVAALPLARVGADLDGTLQARLHLRGALAAPRVDGTYAVNGLKIRRPEARFMPAMAAAGSLSLAGPQATFDAKLSGGATALAVKGRATLPRGRTPLSLSAKVTGTGDLALLGPLAGTAVQGLSGRLQPDLDITMNGDKLSGSGTLAITGLALNQPASGLHLERGEALLVLRDQLLQVQRLSLRTAGGGEITATGAAQLDGARGFPVDLQVVVRKALLANRPDLVATASGTLKIVGSVNDGFTVSGPVTVDRAEINIGVSQSADYPTIEVREINKPGVANPPPAPKRRAGAPPPPPKPVGGPAVRLALTVEAPRAVFVRGRGLDAEVQGKFDVGGLASQPAVTGALSLRRGDFTLAGRRLVFTRGNVGLVRVDSIEPMLDFLASTSAGGTTVSIAITGTSRAPKIALTSSPALPQDELMAMLLFGRATSSLSPFEMLQVAQAIAELTGVAEGGGLVGGLRKKLGLDRLSIDTSGTDPSSTAVSGGRYVAPGVYLGAKQGASAGSSRGVVEIEVLRNTKIEADIGADSNGRIGVKMEWDY